MSNQIDTNQIQDPILKALLEQSKATSNDLLNSMSQEWDVILNETDLEIKVRKLHAALIKEQTRRETAEKLAQEAKMYTDIVQEQTSQRVSELRNDYESRIDFLNKEINRLKDEAEQDLNYYRNQLEKANQHIAKHQTESM